MDSSGIAAMEDRLRAAMMDSDVSVLNQLLADDLVFTNHLGGIMSKQDDLEAHRSGLVRISSISQSEQHVRLHDDVAVVSVLSRIQGDFNGKQAESALRFTRVWQRNENDRWQVIAAHSCLVHEE